MRNKGTTMAATVAADGADEFAGLMVSWRRSLVAERKAPKTITGYLHEIALLRAWALRTPGAPCDPRLLLRAHIEAYLGAELARRAVTTVTVAYVILCIFFGWLIEEDEMAASPLAHMKPPKGAPVTGAPVLAEADIAALLRACAGNSFADRRDLAMLRVLLDTGLRRAELAALTLDDVDLDAGRLQVRHGKGDKARVVYLGVKTVKALDRYLRLRPTHAHAGLPQLWLTQRGALGDLTVSVRITKRAQQAGLSHPERLHPHLFRHTWAHLWLDAGGSETDLMTMAGWTSLDMLKRYGASAKAARAQKAHARLSPGDRF